jgi:hypothetical protein
MIAQISVHCLTENPGICTIEVSHYFCVVCGDFGITKVYVYSADPRKQYRLPPMTLTHARQYWRWLIQNGNKHLDERDARDAENFRILSTLCRDEYATEIRASLYRKMGMHEIVNHYDIESLFEAPRPFSRDDDSLIEKLIAHEKYYGLFKILCLDSVGKPPGVHEWRVLTQKGDKKIASLVADFLIKYQDLPEEVLAYICDNIGNREKYGLGKDAYTRSPRTQDHPLFAMTLSSMTKKSARSTKSFEYLSRHFDQLLSVEVRDGGSFGYGQYPKGRRVGPTSGIS